MRAALVLGVASLDAYVHQKIVEGFTPQLFAQPPAPLVAKMKEMAKEHPEQIFQVVAAPEPHRQMVSWLEGELERETFQHPGAIANGFKLLAIEDLWTSVAQLSGLEPAELKRNLAEVVHRRHQIAHEADLEQVNGRRRTRRIARGYVDEKIDFIDRVVKAIEGSV